MTLAELARGAPGRPSHPPLTGVAIGAYVAASVLGIAGAAGVAEAELARGWWVALLVGLGAGGLAAATGFLDWRRLEPGTQAQRVATLHMIVMLGATGLFALAAGIGHPGYADRYVPGGPLALTIAGVTFLAVGGRLGGSLVYVYGLRVLEPVPPPAGFARPAAEESVRMASSEWDRRRIEEEEAMRGYGHEDPERRVELDPEADERTEPARPSPPDEPEDASDPRRGARARLRRRRPSQA